MINVDRHKAADLGLTQEDVMQNVVAAFNSSIQFNKHNFWIDPKSKNQYFVGVQYREKDIKSIETLLNIPVDRPEPAQAPVPLRNVVDDRRGSTCRREVTHYNIQPTIELTMGVYGRDLGHVSDDVTRVLGEFGKPDGRARPGSPTTRVQPAEADRCTGSKIVLSGEYRGCRTPSPASVPGWPGVAADLLPDGRPGQVVRRAADGHVDRPALA